MANAQSPDGSIQPPATGPLRLLEQPRVLLEIGAKPPRKHVLGADLRILAERALVLYQQLGDERCVVAT